MTHSSFLITAFFLSGLSCLCLELIWTRLALRVLGSTTEAFAFVLATFMVGLAVGSAIFGLILKGLQSTRTVILAYAFCEFLIAMSAFWLAYQSPFNLASILLPCLLMGGTFPLVLRALKNKTSLGLAYGANVLGAFLAAVLTPCILLANFGLCGSALWAGTMSLLSMCFSAASLFFRTSEADQELGGKENRTEIRTLLAAFVCGFLGLYLEIVWTRFFALFFGASVYTTSTVLAIGLLAIGMGSIYGKHKEDTLLGQGAMLLLSLSTFISLSNAAIFALSHNIETFTLANLWLSAGLFKSLPPLFNNLLCRQVLCLLLFFPSMFILGRVFPLIAKLKPGAEWAVYAVNTAGGVAGAVTACLLIPALAKIANSGINASLCLAASVAALTTFCFPSLPSKRGNHFSKVAALGLLSLFLCNSWDLVNLARGLGLYGGNLGHRPEQFFYRDGMNSSVSMEELARNNSLVLRNNGKVEACIPKEARKQCIGSDLPTHLMMAALPLLLAEGKPRKALVIGMGTKTATRALGFAGELAVLKTIEIEEAVVAAQFFFQPSLNELFGNMDQSQIIRADGRSLLSQDEEIYDIIVSQPPDPWVSGSGDLFSFEFFELVRKRLDPKGIFCQWIPVYGLERETVRSLLATISKVFPESLVFHAPDSAELIVVSSPTRLSLNAINNEVRRDKLKKLLQLANIKNVEDLKKMFRLGPLQLKAYLSREPSPIICTDDNLLAELQAAKAVLSHGLDWSFSDEGLLYSQEGDREDLSSRNKP